MLQLSWAEQDSKYEVQAYDDLAMANYYLGDLKKSKYYSTRALNGDIEVDQIQTINYPNSMKKNFIGTVQYAHILEYEALKRQTKHKDGKSSLVERYGVSFLFQPQDSSDDEELQTYTQKSKNPHSTLSINTKSRYNHHYNNPLLPLLFPHPSPFLL